MIDSTCNHFNNISMCEYLLASVWTVNGFVIEKSCRVKLDLTFITCSYNHSMMSNNKYHKSFIMIVVHS